MTYYDLMRDNNTDSKNIGYFNLLKNPRYTLAAISAVFGYYIYGYMDPILSIRLSEFEMSEYYIVLFFTIKPAIYMIFSVLV
jgi:hypothetical protein